MRNEKMKNKLKLFMTLSLIGIASHGRAATNLAGCTEDKFVFGGENNSIKIVDKSYEPRCLKIKAGSSVTIDASQRHPLTAITDINGVTNPFANGSHFNSAQMRVMGQAGAFGYFCESHGDSEGDGMAGVIVVE